MSYKEHEGNALASRAEEGRGKTTKSPGELSSEPSRGYPNGATPSVKAEDPHCLEQEGGNLGNRNILVPRGKERYSPSSGERNGRSPNPRKLSVLRGYVIRG